MANVACNRVATRLPASSAATAVIGASEATFVFPAESVLTFTYDVPQPRTYAGEPEFIWEVTWDQPDDRVGVDPEALSLIVGRRLGGPREGPLEDVINRDTLVMLTVCRTCDLADTPESHPNLTASAANNRVVFTVKGSQAVRRIFAVTPDSVTFLRIHRDPDTETSLTVRVFKRD